MYACRVSVRTAKQAAESASVGNSACQHLVLVITRGNPFRLLICLTISLILPNLDQQIYSAS